MDINNPDHLMDIKIFIKENELEIRKTLFDVNFMYMTDTSAKAFFLAYICCKDAEKIEDSKRGLYPISTDANYVNDFHTHIGEEINFKEKNKEKLEYFWNHYKEYIKSSLAREINITDIPSIWGCCYSLYFWNKLKVKIANNFLS